MNRELIDKFISKLCKQTQFYNRNTKEISIEEELCNEFKKDLSINSIETRRGKVVLDKSKLPFSFFIDTIEFREEVSENDLSKSLIISDYANSILFYENSSGKTFINDKQVNSFLIENAKIYFDSLNLFKELYANTCDGYDFIDYLSETKREIVLSSLTDRKKVSLVYPKAGIPQLNENFSYSKAYNEFKNAFSSTNKHLPKFIKSSIINHIAFVTGSKYVNFFEKLEEILKEAKLNFSIYLHDLSLDSLKKEYQEYKQKYFAEQNEILAKVSNQVIALPISIAGSVFALYSIKDSLFGIILIMIGIQLFTVYLSYLISLYWNDLQKIKNLIITDFTSLSLSPFFQENKNELSDFEHTKNWMLNRTRKLGRGIQFFGYTIWIINFTLIAFALHLKLSLTFNVVVFFMSLVIIDIILLINDYIFQEE